MVPIDGEDDAAEELDVVDLEDNLSDAEKVPDVPPGVYTAEVQDVQRKTSDRGNDYYAIRLVVPQNKLPGDLRDHYPDGASLFWNRQMVPGRGDRRALYNLKLLYTAMGLDTAITRVDPNEWMGRTVRVRVVHEKYRGQNTVQVKAIEAAEDEAPRAAARGKAAPAKVAARGGRGR